MHNYRNNNPKYGDPVNNPKMFSLQNENKADEALNGYVDEHKNAYTVYPDIERAKRKIHFYKVLRILFIVLCILLVVGSLVTYFAVLPKLDDKSALYRTLIGISFAAFILGLLCIPLIRAVHVDISKCELVILSQEDDK